LRAGPPAEGVCHSTSDKPLANASFSRKNSGALLKTRCTFVQKSLVSRFSAGKPACCPRLGEVLGIARHPDGSRAARAPSVGRETQGTQSPPSFCASRSRRAPLEPLSRRPSESTVVQSEVQLGVPLVRFDFEFWRVPNFFWCSKRRAQFLMWQPKAALSGTGKNWSRAEQQNRIRLGVPSFRHFLRKCAAAARAARRCPDCRFARAARKSYPRRATPPARHP